jgi:hypothetical protein
MTVNWADESWLDGYQERAKMWKKPGPCSLATGETAQAPDNEIPDEGLERDLQQRCEDYLDQEALYFIHDRSKKANRPGILDLTVFLWGGVTVSFELKSKNGSLSKEQKETVSKLRMLGHEVHTSVRSYQRFVKIIQGHKRRWLEGREQQA